MLACALAALAGGCGGARHRTNGATPAVVAPAPPTPGVVEGERPALGLTEDDAALLWSPTQPSRTPPQFQPARAQLTALHPSYVRLLVDWAALQPRPDRPADLASVVSGCSRQVGPCAPYAGLTDELAAIATQQHAAGSTAGFRVVLDIFGVPSWAASAPHGCEGGGASAFSRALRPQAIPAYRALIRSLLSLGRREGVALEWWSPWNEPNDPRFLSPQRTSCDPRSTPASAAVYSELARAMAAELSAVPGSHRLVLGELNNLELDTPHSTSVATFVAALPPDVLCLDGVWSIHAYARHAPASPAGDAVRALETALDARGACGRKARVWVTEAGAGAPHPGRPRQAGPADERAGCMELARQLERWSSNPRVDAVFQYSFREDPAFPVGLETADLARLYPSYRLWLEWSHRRAEGRPPPPAGACT